MPPIPPNKISTPSLGNRSIRQSNVFTSGGSTGGNGARGITPRRTAVASIPPTGQFPNVTLSEEEELAILERLESGDWTSGAGWGQFLNPIRSSAQSSSTTSNAPIKQNLSSVFANVDAHSTGIDFSQDLTEVPPEPEVVIPLYLKKADNVMEEIDKLKELVEQAIDAILSEKFAQICSPQKFEETIEAMKRAATLLKSYSTVDSKSSEVMKIFCLSRYEPQSNTLPCPVEEQESFLQAIHELNKNLKSVSKHLRCKKELGIEEKMEQFKSMLEGMEGDLQRAAKDIKEIERYASMFKKFKPPTPPQSPLLYETRSGH